MTLFNPQKETFAHLDARSREILLKTVEYFETRGKKRLKSDSHERAWYVDFIQFMNENRVMSTLLIRPRTPRAPRIPAGIRSTTLISTKSWGSTISPTGTPGRCSSWELCPIFMGKNEAVKKKPPACSRMAASSPSAFPKGPTAPTSTPRK